jgi:hypothetical protein
VRTEEHSPLSGESHVGGSVSDSHKWLWDFGDCAPCISRTDSTAGADISHVTKRTQLVCVLDSLFVVLTRRILLDAGSASPAKSILSNNTMYLASKVELQRYKLPSANGKVRYGEVALAEDRHASQVLT